MKRLELPPTRRPGLRAHARRARGADRAARRPGRRRSAATCAGIKPDRGDVILGGALVLAAAMDRGGFDAVEVTEAGLREGVFFERLLGERELFDDVRRESVENLAHRFNSEPAHDAARGRAVARRCSTGSRAAGPARVRRRRARAALGGLRAARHRHRDRLRRPPPPLALPDPERGPARLHPRELVLVGLIARYHRKGDPDAVRAGRARRARRRRAAALLCAIIRLAEQLERSRDGAIRAVAGGRRERRASRSRRRPTRRATRASRSGRRAATPTCWRRRSAARWRSRREARRRPRAARRGRCAATSTAVAVLLPTIRAGPGLVGLGRAVGDERLPAGAGRRAAARAAGRLRRPARWSPAAGALAMAAGAVVCATADSTVDAGRGPRGRGRGRRGALLAPARRPQAPPAARAPRALALALGPLAGGVLAEQQLVAPLLLGGRAGARRSPRAGAAARVPRRAPAAPACPGCSRSAAGLTAVTIALVQCEPWGVGLGGARVLVVGRRRCWPGAGAVLDAGRATWARAWPAAWRRSPSCCRSTSSWPASCPALRSGALLLGADASPPSRAGRLAWRLARVVPARRARGRAGWPARRSALLALETLDADSALRVLLGGLAAGRRRARRWSPRAAGGGGELPSSRSRRRLAGAALGLAAAGAAVPARPGRRARRGASFEHALRRRRGPGGAAAGAAGRRRPPSRWTGAGPARPASSAARPAAAS